MKEKDITDEIKPALKLTDKEKVKLYEQDGILALYLAQNRKLNEIAKSLNDVVINIDADDKSFERWHKITVDGKPVLEGIEYLKALVLKEYGLEQLNETTLETSNVVEKFLKSKQQ